MSSSPGETSQPANQYWREQSVASDSSETRRQMQDALEQMAAEVQEEEEELYVEDSDFEYDQEDDDDDYQDAEEDDDDDDEDDEYPIRVEEIGMDEDEEDEDDFDEDEDEEDDDLEDEDVDVGGEEEEDGAIRIDFQQLIQQALSGTDGGVRLTGLRQLLAQGFPFRTSTAGDDDDDDSNWYGSTTRRSGLADFWEPIKEPIQAGQELSLGGEFGRTPRRPPGSPQSAFDPGKNLASRISDRRTSLKRIAKTEIDDMVPNSIGTEVARYPARVYCGQYSEDSSFFYTCTQDFRVQMYDTTAASSRRVLRMDDVPSMPRRSRFYTSFGTTQYTSLKPIKTIQGRMGNWTITDANLSPDNRWMIYSSINPVVHLVSTKAESQGEQDHSDRQVPLDFGAADDETTARYTPGIWSIRFSGDSREIVAGAHFGDIYVYDIEARRRVLKVEGHRDDVNGVAFADSASSNVLISGSDDSFVKVWDRRSLSGGKPAGVLPGHTEGITYVAPKGDGRYCISNGKDQSLRLWDLRSMKSSADLEAMGARDYGLRNWDYRNMYYRKPRFAAHPEDCSVMTYRGHAVLKTLIRCHFSPAATTGQKYLYSGSADGRIHIWSLDGQVVQVLDRSKARTIFGEDELAADPSAPLNYSESTDEAMETSEGTASTTGRPTGYSRAHNHNSPSAAVTVRDVAWHSSEASLMSSAWDGQDQQRGSVAKHEWMGWGKGMQLEDVVQRDREERMG